MAGNGKYKQLTDTHRTDEELRAYLGFYFLSSALVPLIAPNGYKVLTNASPDATSSSGESIFGNGTLNMLINAAKNLRHGAPTLAISWHPL